MRNANKIVTVVTYNDVSADKKSILRDNRGKSPPPGRSSGAVFIFEQIKLMEKDM
jgi:hypothetical protein